jgi:hypothetical protein
MQGGRGVSTDLLSDRWPGEALPSAPEFSTRMPPAQSPARRADFGRFYRASFDGYLPYPPIGLRECSAPNRPF